MSRAWAGGSTRAWRKTRAQVLQRDGHRCRRCGRPATQVHHPNGKANGDRLDDLESLCDDCHMAETRKQMTPAPRNTRPTERHPGLT